MPFTLIKGTFHVVGYSPDGDSLKFKANNPNTWKKIEGTVKFNKKKHAQLRMEGIDALETHYRPALASGNLHQPHVWAQAARDFLIKSVGITNVQWGPAQSKVTSANDGVKGYILTRGIDNAQYGRPVSFVFKGTPHEPDGASVNLTAARTRRSMNYKLLLNGLAYPTYYKSFFADFRDEFNKAVAKALKPKPKGLWKKDRTMGLTFNGLTSITDTYPVLPKLFRRLTEHLAHNGTLSTFRKFLADKKDGVTILPQVHHTDALDFVVKVKGKRVGLTVRPEDLIFDG